MKINIPSMFSLLLFKSFPPLIHPKYLILPVALMIICVFVEHFEQLNHVTVMKSFIFVIDLICSEIFTPLHMWFKQLCGSQVLLRWLSFREIFSKTPFPWLQLWNCNSVIRRISPVLSVWSWRQHWSQQIGLIQVHHPSGTYSLEAFIHLLPYRNKCLTGLEKFLH